MAELLAVQEGVDLFLKSEWSSMWRVIVESDCKMVVDWVTQVEDPTTPLSEIVFNLGEKIKDRGMIVRLIPRRCNTLAGGLAKSRIG
ncbi:hypothetical protein HRI_002395800 [Hibiscus trionum]|uniref:RNase H type-1 domain-containing protein n=1 Tax=Hibiscus trionum TaxID=183268 RepID=A0A9W7I491_HIBTR|nr:hypothetical protein HRI_002395800 [Hibiscus trionum]